MNKTINSRNNSMLFKDLYFIRYNQLTWNLETNGHQNQIRQEFLTRKRNVKQKSKKKKSWRLEIWVDVNEGRLISRITGVITINWMPFDSGLISNCGWDISTYTHISTICFSDFESFEFIAMSLMSVFQVRYISSNCCLTWSLLQLC